MNPGYTRSMRAVMLEVPEGFLEDRRRKGLDKRDEVWDGVLHMVPPATFRHQTLGSELLVVLHRLARSRGLQAVYEVGLFDPTKGLDNYRVPDLVLVEPKHASERGVEGRAALVVEILSPNDESRDKLPFYARTGVSEVWLVHPVTRVIEIFTLAEGELVEVAPAAGSVRSPLLGIELTTVAGPKLQIRDGAHVDEI